MNENSNNPEPLQHDLFEENEFVEFDLASNNQRFFNYLVDNLLMNFVISYASGYLVAKLLLAVSPETAYDWFGKEDNLLAAYFIALFNHLVYYTFCESAFNGRTLGKLLTGTKAIREDGQRITFKDAILRSLSRLVPFEAFSIWSEKGMWHDTWTHTRVIRSR